MSAKRKTAGENAARTAPEMRAASEVRPSSEMGTVPEEFSALLLDWYRKNARVLPWREDPSPYRVWVSEIMLQQTRVEAVKPYFERFLAALPDLEALASAEEEKLLKLWEGLGYYNRVKNMQKAAVMALEEYGGLPEAAEELIRLPGIGPYTAGAVASIAFGQPVPAVDGNVLRVMTRLLAYGADISSATVKKEVETALRPHVASDPRAFNQALMELGATVCLPNGAPKCERCPVASLCAAHRDGQELSYPVKRAKKERRQEYKTIFLLEFDGNTAVYRRPEKGLLAGLWAFPEADDDLEPEEVAPYLEEMGFSVRNVESLGPSRHIFSHVEWHMKGYRVILGRLPDGPAESADRASENGPAGASDRASANRPSGGSTGDMNRASENGLAGVSGRASVNSPSGGSSGAFDDGAAETVLTGSLTVSGLHFLPTETILSSYALPSAYRAYTARLKAEG